MCWKNMDQSGSTGNICRSGPIKRNFVFTANRQHTVQTRVRERQAGNK